MWFHFPNAESVIEGQDYLLVLSFTVKDRMVLNFEVVILLEKILDLIRKVVRAETSLGSSKVVETSGDPHISENVTGLNGMMKELEERGLFVGGQTVVDPG